MTLAKQASQRLGRRCTVRLAQRGMLGLVDWQARLVHWFSWDTDEPADSPRNVQHFADAVEWLEARG